MNFFTKFAPTAGKKPATRGGRSYRCRCGRPVFFRNSECLACHTALGYEPELAQLLPIEPGTKAETWRVAGRVPGARKAYRRCANLNTPAACNWLVADLDKMETHRGLCVACRLNRTIPDLSVPENSKLWGRIEAAKRRVISTLLTLNMPVRSKTEDPERGLAFDFLHSPEGGPPVTTGHANGLITLNIEEACSSVRERIREELNEPYRTLLGHFRHEIGHYYWDRLIQGSAWIDEFRKLFGDERADYAESLKRHYAQGPPVNWEATFISSYASSHPWEDWAETWAHMLHMADTLDTARSFGLDPQNLDLEIEPFTREALDKADDPEADNFLTFLNAWVALSAVMNEMSRAMGEADFYPFALPRAAAAKLQFLSIVVRAERDRLRVETAAAD
ncbi:MAG: putative zinc-binding metallopeptidase [Acidobacteriia bacterium]|nr:putative zinc-binding metallopeptidase [Terriglobia bacterium]